MKLYIAKIILDKDFFLHRTVQGSNPLYMTPCRNWSWEKGDCGNTSARPGQHPKPSAQGKVLAADWEGTGIATITYLS